MIRVTVCNIQATIIREIVAFFLSAYGRFVDILQLWAAAGTTHGDSVFRVCLDRKNFRAIPDTIYHKDKQIMVGVEGRQPFCWSCKQVGHIAKVCPQNDPKEAETTQRPKLLKVDATKEKSLAKNQPSMEDGWTQMTRTRRKSDTPKKAKDALRDPKPITPVPKEPAPMTQKTPTPAPKNIVSFRPKKTQTSKYIPMDSNSKFKENDSGEGNAKNSASPEQNQSHPPSPTSTARGYWSHD